MPDVAFQVGQPMTIVETRAVLDNIVPPQIRQKYRFQEPRMLAGLLQHMAVRVEHEVNRVRGIAFTSNEDEGFTHATD